MFIMINQNHTELAFRVAQCVQVYSPSFRVGDCRDLNEYEIQERRKDDDLYGDCLDAVMDTAALVEAQGGMLRSRQVIATIVLFTINARGARTGVSYVQNLHG